MDFNHIFKDIKENAFEFLEQSLLEFEQKPKFSIVHLAASVELFMKARLIREHWSLIAENIDKIDKNRLLSGDLLSVKPRTARERLHKIANDPLSKDAIKTFEEIEKHRNQAIHLRLFNISSDLERQREVDKIVGLQCRAWNQLHTLLNEQWGNHFSQFSIRIQDTERLMIKHREYLTAKFNSRQKLINQHLEDGNRVTTCHSCDFDSMLLSHVDGVINNGQCCVCSEQELFYFPKCLNQDCDQEIKFSDFSGPPSECPHCHTAIFDRIPELFSNHEDFTDDIDQQHIMNCSFCSSYDSIVAHSKHYLCINCFSYADKLSICEWCNTGQTGDVSNMSYYSGCGFCEGQSGWDDDEFN